MVVRLLINALLAIRYASCMGLSITQEPAAISSVSPDGMSDSSLRYLEAIGSYVGVEYGVILNTEIYSLQSITVYSFDQSLSVIKTTAFMDGLDRLGLVAMNNEALPPLLYQYDPMDSTIMLFAFSSIDIYSVTKLSGLTAINKKQSYQLKYKFGLVYAYLKKDYSSYLIVIDRSSFCDVETVAITKTTLSSSMVDKNHNLIKYDLNNFGGQAITGIINFLDMNLLDNNGPDCLAQDRIHPIHLNDDAIAVVASTTLKISIQLHVQLYRSSDLQHQSTVSEGNAYPFSSNSSPQEYTIVQAERDPFNDQNIYVVTQVTVSLFKTGQSLQQLMVYKLESFIQNMPISIKGIKIVPNTKLMLLFTGASLQPLIPIQPNPTVVTMNKLIAFDVQNPSNTDPSPFLDKNGFIAKDIDLICMLRSISAFACCDLVNDKLFYMAQINEPTGNPRLAMYSMAYSHPCKDTNCYYCVGRTSEFEVCELCKPGFYLTPEFRCLSSVPAGMGKVSTSKIQACSTLGCLDCEENYQTCTKMTLIIKLLQTRTFKTPLFDNNLKLDLKLENIAGIPLSAQEMNQLHTSISSWTQISFFSKTVRDLHTKFHISVDANSNSSPGELTLNVEFRVLLTSLSTLFLFHLISQLLLHWCFQIAIQCIQPQRLSARASHRCHPKMKNRADSKKLHQS